MTINIIFKFFELLVSCAILALIFIACNNSLIFSIRRPYSAYGIVSWLLTVAAIIIAFKSIFAGILASYIAMMYSEYIMDTYFGAR